GSARPPGRAPPRSTGCCPRHLGLSMSADHLRLFADRILKVGNEAVGDVDVEAADGHDAAVLIGDGIADHDHLEDLTGGGADAVSATEGSRRLGRQCPRRARLSGTGDASTMLIASTRPKR